MYLNKETCINKLVVDKTIESSAIESLQKKLTLFVVFMTEVAIFEKN